MKNQMMIVVWVLLYITRIAAAETVIDHYTIKISSDRKNIAVTDNKTKKSVLTDTLTHGYIAKGKRSILYDHFDFDQEKDFAILHSSGHYRIYLSREGKFLYAPRYTQIASHSNKSPYRLDRKTAEIITEYQSDGYLENRYYTLSYGMPIWKHTKVYDKWMMFDRVTTSALEPGSRSKEIRYTESRDVNSSDFREILEVSLEDGRTVSFYQDAKESNALYHVIYSAKKHPYGVITQNIFKTMPMCKAEGVEIIFRDNDIGYSLSTHKNHVSFSGFENGKIKKYPIKTEGIKGSFEAVCKKPKEIMTRTYKRVMANKEPINLLCAQDGSLMIVDLVDMSLDGIWFGKQSAEAFPCDILFSDEPNSIQLTTKEGYMKVDLWSKTREKISKNKAH